MASLEELLQQSVELENKKKELNENSVKINDLIAAERKRIESEKIQLVTIEKIINENVIVIDTNGTPRSDVLTLLQATPSRYYDYVNKKNQINILYWKQFTNALAELPNIQLAYLEKNKEVIEQYFTEKLWFITKNEKFIIIKQAKRNTESYKINKIPSVMWNTNIKSYTVPFSEGWRVIQVLPLSDEVEYTPEVLALIESQVEQRRKMDEVALNNNADIPNPFTQINPENGKLYELKPFQKAGVFFAMAALGLEMPVEIEVKKEVKPW